MEITARILQGKKGRWRWLLYDENSVYRGGCAPYGFETYGEAYRDAQASLGSQVTVHSEDGSESFTGYRDFSD